MSESSDNDDPGAIVIPLEFAPDLPGIDPERVVVKRRSYRECLHRQTVIHVEDRCVTCKHCEKQLDPFDVLKELADEWQRDWFSLRHARTEAARFLEEAKKERRNAKAAKRRAEKRAVDA